MAKTVRLVLGDQLNHKHSWFERTDDTVLYVLMEVRQETDYVRHHVQKVLAFFGAMRRFRDWLEEEGHRVRYFALDDEDNTQSLPDNLQLVLDEQEAEVFGYLLPDEFRLDEQLHTFGESLKQEVVIADTEHFLCSRDEVGSFFGEKSWLMERFYREMRKKHDVLMEDGEPAGGEWNYDAENREAYDGEVEVPEPLAFDHDLSDLAKLLDEAGVETLGNVDASKVHWPLSREEALAQLDWFVEKALPHFGTYQDALEKGEWSMFHSRLSFALNVKLLDPLEVVQAVEEAWEQDGDRYALNHVEGFIRQIIGWREYMRGVYWAEMPGYAEKNFFGYDRKLPEWFWTGKTKMACLSDCIGQSLDRAYAHHIQRLMVTGNFALLAGIDPAEVDAWYLGIYIDAIEWVELPNTRGMSQYADGGLVGSKPYVSSANYINKMGNYCKNCSYSHTVKVGEGACPFNVLYWHFYDRHREQLSGNPRIGMMYRTWDRMGEEKQERIRKQAEGYLDRIEEL